MDPQEDSAPVEISTEDAFERDVSDIDMPGFEDVQAASADSTDEQDTEAVAAGEAEDAEQTVDVKAKALADAKVAEASTSTPAAKKVAFKAGDGKAVELLEDAVVDWKVDGKVTPIPLKDLLQNYSGKVVYEKRFQEVAEQRKQVAETVRTHEQEKNRHVTAINNMHKAASEGRTFDAVTEMLKLTGTKASPREYIKNLRDGLIKQAAEMAKLSPEQRELYEEREEIAYLRSENQQSQQAREQEQAVKQFHERVVRAIGSANTTAEEYVNTRDWLLEEGPKLEGRSWDPSRVTPEYVANQIRDIRDYRTAKEALDAVSPELAKSETTWKQAVEFMRSNPDWSTEDLKEVYREATKAKRSESISKKVAKSPTATTATASASKTGKKVSREDFSSFGESDLDW